ncbi:unnamed protein product, partial [Rotaria sp. Silwood2]
MNLITNGDGATGPCETAGGITHPTGWNYNGTVTQISYNNPTYGDLSLSDPGPSNRGQCYFFGQISSTTTMWQTINLMTTVLPTLIDSQTVFFNFSAWIGGWSTQNDNAQASLTYKDQLNQQVGSTTTIGPVLASDRGGVSSLLFRQAQGQVPSDARTAIVLVKFTCVD